MSLVLVESGNMDLEKPQCGDPENWTTLYNINSIKKGKFMGISQGFV